MKKLPSNFLSGVLFLLRLTEILKAGDYLSESFLAALPRGAAYLSWRLA